MRIAKNIGALIFLLALFSNFSSVNTAYRIDKGHTFIQFGVERFMVGEVLGQFKEFEGDVTLNGDDASSLKVDMIIKTKSLDTGHELRDGHLKGKMWLDTEVYPDIKFKSTKMTKNHGKLMMKGELTIRGITNEVTFPIVFMGPFQDPTKNTTVGIKADFIIDRSDYGIKFNKVMDNGSLFIGKKVNIKIRALAGIQK